MSSVVTAAIFGWFLMVGILFSIPDMDTGMLGFWEICRVVIGEGGAIALSALFCCIVFMCTMGSMTSNSRMIYAFSRDGALPGSSWIRHIDPKTKTPVRAVIVSTMLAALLGLPSVGSSVALTALVSIGTIGQYLSYASPILLRITVGAEDFKPGPFHFGRYSKLIGWIAVIWVCFIVVIFCLPSTYPVTGETLNYAPILVGAVIAWSGLYWVFSAKNWYTGPQVTVSDEDIAEMEASVSVKA